MKFVNWCVEFLKFLFNYQEPVLEDEVVETQIREAITFPLKELNAEQLAKLQKGDVVIVPITRPAIKNIMANGTTEHFFSILEIVKAIGNELKYQLGIYPDLTGHQIEYFMVVTVHPDDDFLTFDDDDDSDAKAEIVEPEPEIVEVPLKAMAAGAGKRY